MALPTWATDRPESSYVLLTPVVLAWEAWRTRKAPARPLRSAAIPLLIATPIAITLGSELNSPTLGLGGLALGVGGVALFTGRPPLPIPILAVWLVRVPVSFLEIFTPELETIWMDLANVLLSGVGADLEQVGPVVFGPENSRLEVQSEQCGFLLAHGFALVGAFRAIGRDDRARAFTFCTLRWAVAGFVLQGPVVLVATSCIALGHEGAAKATLSWGPVALVTSALLWSACAGAREKHNGPAMRQRAASADSQI